MPSSSTKRTHEELARYAPMLRASLGKILRGKHSILILILAEPKQPSSIWFNSSREVFEPLNKIIISLGSTI